MSQPASEKGATVASGPARTEAGMSPLDGDLPRVMLSASRPFRMDKTKVSVAVMLATAALLGWIAYACLAFDPQSKEGDAPTSSAVLEYSS